MSQGFKITRKGLDAARYLAKYIGNSDATITTLSRIARLATTHSRLAEIECSVAMTEKEAERLTKRVEGIERAITSLVGELPRYKRKPLTPVFSGDPRGYTVKIRVPGEPHEGNTWGRGGEFGIGGGK